MAVEYTWDGSNWLRKGGDEDHDHSSGSGQARLAAKDRTITKILYIETPTDADEFPIVFLADAVTMVRVFSVTDAGTVDFNIERRAKLTPDQAGTDIMTVDQSADAGGEETLVGGMASSGEIAAEQWLTYVDQSNATGSPTKLWIGIEYTID